MTIRDTIMDWFFRTEPSRNRIVSIVAGVLFFVGWWILIDAMSSKDHQITTGQVFIGIFGTVSFFMVNTVKNSHISEENLSQSGARIAKVWLLIGFVIGFAATIAAIWVMIDDFINVKGKSNWAGVALLVQNVLILFGSLTYKFGRNEEDWND